MLRVAVTAWHRAGRYGLATGVAASGAALCMSMEAWLDQPLDPTTSKTVAAFQDPEEWVRVDQVTTGNQFVPSSHAIFGSLGAETNAVEAYRVFAKTDGSEVKAVVKFGKTGCTGHPGIVHGGVTALLFDNTIGFANAVSKLAEDGNLDVLVRAMQNSREGDNRASPLPSTPSSTRRFGFTAALTVNYRNPCYPDSTVVLTCRLERAQGRKRDLVATMVDANTGALIAEASSLFVLPRPPPTLWQRVQGLLGQWRGAA